MKFCFDYLIKKINSSKITTQPFEHIEIKDFLSTEHFQKIITAQEVNINQVEDDHKLIKRLLSRGWEPIKFPGCTDSIKEYLNWRANNTKFCNVDTCEGFGMALILKRPQSKIIRDLKEFIESKKFQMAVSKKFLIDFDAVYSDVGIQKYLDGYEISPHPDIRKKALTFMVNINPHKKSETLDYHTHYMRFKLEKLYVQEFWKYNDQYDRSWVPWEWCTTYKKQIANNSITLFRPSFNTLHAVKASYDHLDSQRTQMYGNLWYGSKSVDDVRSTKLVATPQIPWQGLIIDETKGSTHVMTNNIRSNIFARMAKKASSIFGG